MTIEHLKTSDLIPYARNAKKHDASQVAKLAGSIREFGFTNPVLIDRDNGIIAGHGRVMAAQSLALESVPCIRLGHLTDTQRRAYILADNRLADNRLAEIGGGWDEEMLKLELADLAALDFDVAEIGFGDEDLAEVPEEEEEKSTDGNFAEQYAVTVICKDEAHQRKIYDKLTAEGMADAVPEITVYNAANTEHLDEYKAFLYDRLQRKGFDRADIHRLAARDRHVFGALMLAHGHGDGLVTGATRKSAHVLELINHVFDASPASGAVGVSAVLNKGRIVLIADTLVHEWPDEEDLANIATRGAEVARDLGLEPRVAFLSFSTFGYPVSERAEKMHRAPKVLDARGVDFEYEGEMTVDVALNPRAMEQYPFSRLTGPANVLVVPARHSASISVKLMQEMAGATVIGPILAGVDKPIQICSTVSTVNDIFNMAAIAACKVN